MKIKRLIFIPLLCVSLIACSGLENKKSNSAPAKWLELPAISEGEGAAFFSHSVNDGGKNSRNYSFSWDYENLVARWVAYPLCKGNIGSGTRTNEWGLNPCFSKADQPVLFYGYTEGNNGNYDRGHQIPSADRLNRSANIQTFYGTNMTPQDKDLNSGLWNSLEKQIRDWARNTDTLYVVSGCVTDGSKYYVFDNEGKKVTVPVGYYKALLRYDKSGMDGAEGYLGLAVYVENRSYREANLEKYMTMSIDELEKKVGVDFFVNLSDAIENEVEAQRPVDVDWWWK